MHPHRQLDPDSPLPLNTEALMQDLELPVLLEAMSRGDGFLKEAAGRALLTGLVDPEAIRYRQDVLADCLRRPSVLRETYRIAVEAAELQKRNWLGMMRSSPDAILASSHRTLESLFPLLVRLRRIADTEESTFASQGWRRFFATLRRELSDDYLAEVQDHLRALNPDRGVLLNARLGDVTEAVAYLVRRPRGFDWKDWIPVWGNSAFSFQIPPRDDAGFRALSDIRSRGTNRVANAVAQSADHIRDFFRMLRAELAFYVGCLNLHETLTAKGEPTCFPEPHPVGSNAFRVEGLYDVSLSLNVDERVVGNDVAADGKTLIVITGANRGGKSTFLRSVGLAQLMMQAGMFVPAVSYRAGVVRGVFTHYKREEDSTMQRGKLEEELARMSDIADSIGPGCLLLCNESFASTNEREGSEIGYQVVRALTEAGVRVFYVTHLYHLAHRLHTTNRGQALFLRAPRGKGGRRPFKLVEGEPLSTSFGPDLYRRIFGEDSDVAVAAVAAPPTNPHSQYERS